jgi:uncharacterized membrane protein HdeD (DUF308 family)
MNVLGWIFLVLIAAVVVVGVVALIAGIPDIKRYLKIRAM